MGRFFRRGQAILEAALVLPILLVIIFGVFGIGQLMAVKGVVYASAGEGARIAAYYGVTSSGSSCSVPATTQQKVVQAVTDNFAANKLPGFVASRDMVVNLQPVIINGSGSTNNQCLVTVTIHYPYTIRVPFLAVLLGSTNGIVTLSGEATYDANSN